MSHGIFLVRCHIMLDYSVVDIYYLMYVSIYSLRNIYLFYRRLAYNDNPDSFPRLFIILILRLYVADSNCSRYAPKRKFARICTIIVDIYIYMNIVDSVWITTIRRWERHVLIATILIRYFSTAFLFTNDFSLALRRNAFLSVSRRIYKAGPLNVHGRTSFRDCGNDCEKITVNCFSTIRRSWTDDWVSMIGESIGENVSVSWLWNVLS